MDRRRALVAIAVAGILGACFPAYEIGSGASDAGGDGGSSPDATTFEAGGEAGGETSAETSAESGMTGGEGGRDASADAAPSDAPAPYDGPPPDAMTVLGSGTYDFLVGTSGGGNSFLDASAVLTHSVAIDDYEVTVDRFKVWVTAQMPLPDAGASLDPGGPYDTVMKWDSSWNADATDTAFENPSQCNAAPTASFSNYISTDAHAGSYPVNCVNWFQALAFCAFEGQKRLPTDTEWRIVAQGEHARTTYPWGDMPASDCAHAITSGCPWPTPVGSASQGHTPDGIFDLSGSLPEWVWDRVPTGIQYSYPTTTTTDYTGLASVVNPVSDFFVVIESGFFSSDLPYDVLGSQYPWTGSLPLPTPTVMGFRCAKTL